MLKAKIADLLRKYAKSDVEIRVDGMTLPNDAVLEAVKTIADRKQRSSKEENDLELMNRRVALLPGVSACSITTDVQRLGLIRQYKVEVDGESKPHLSYVFPDGRHFGLKLNAQMGTGGNRVEVSQIISFFKSNLYLCLKGSIDLPFYKPSDFLAASYLPTRGIRVSGSFIKGEHLESEFNELRFVIKNGLGQGPLVFKGRMSFKWSDPVTSSNGVKKGEGSFTPKLCGGAKMQTKIQSMAGGIHINATNEVRGIAGLVIGAGNFVSPFIKIQNKFITFLDEHFKLKVNCGAIGAYGGVLTCEKFDVQKHSESLNNLDLSQRFAGRARGCDCYAIANASYEVPFSHGIRGRVFIESGVSGILTSHLKGEEVPSFFHSGCSGFGLSSQRGDSHFGACVAFPFAAHKGVRCFVFCDQD